MEIETVKNDVGMSWEMVRFVDVVKDITGGNQKFQSSEYLPLGKYPIIDQGDSFIGGYSNTNAVVNRTKDVVIFGDHTKALKFVDFDFCLGADGVKVLQPVESLDSKFLYYYLGTINLPDVGYSRHYKFLKEIEIPLPPLPIQRRIAEILDAADALRRKDQQLLKKYDELAQAIFIDMFGDPVKNEKGWEVKTIEEATTFIDYRGKTPERSDKEEIPLITAKNVKFGYYDFTEKDFVTLDKYNEIMTRGFPKVGDVLFTTEGATLGNVCRIPDLPKFAIGQRLISMSGRIVTSEYLHYILCADFFQDQVYRYATGSAVKGIRSAVLKKLIIPVPNYDFQLKFTMAILAIEKQIVNANRSYENSNSLFQTLLQKAFKGELVRE